MTTCEAVRSESTHYRLRYELKINHYSVKALRSQDWFVSVPNGTLTNFEMGILKLGANTAKTKASLTNLKCVTLAY